MIKFFRRIRQRLISQNKVGKYLVYAIGEIVLVVIGPDIHRDNCLEY